MDALLLGRSRDLSQEGLEPRGAAEEIYITAVLAAPPSPQIPGDTSVSFKGLKGQARASKALRGQTKSKPWGNR